MLMEACIQVNLLLRLLCPLQTLFWCLLCMGLGFFVHNYHVVKTVDPILPKVMDQEVALFFVASSDGMSDGTSATLDLAGFSLDLYKAQPAKMRGSSRTREGVRDFPAGFATLSWSLL